MRLILNYIVVQQVGVNRSINMEVARNCSCRNTEMKLVQVLSDREQ